MGLRVYLLFCRRVCINADDLMAEQTLIRASGEIREDRRRTEQTGCVLYRTQKGSTRPTPKK